MTGNQTVRLLRGLHGIEQYLRGRTEQGRELCPHPSECGLLANDPSGSRQQNHQKRRNGESAEIVHGVGVYQTVLDQWRIPYDQPLPLLRRQVGAALEGVVRQRVTPIRSLAVDTHGHTHFGSGLAKLLGFDLYTRWHDMRGQWLHGPRDWPPVPGLEPVL